ncbi:MAG: imidazolonepropionase [Treponema sp.]|nr:imidazolonepropionase [Treponema sp.]
MVLKNIGLLASPMGKKVKKGPEQGNITLIENAAIVIECDRITYAGPDNSSIKGDNQIDCKGALITPGLIDCHTHLIFGGWRQKELPMKLAGAAYLDILAAGGGILSTVEKTRAEPIEELYQKTNMLLSEILSYGVTTVEAKSGYGLNTETEVKCLKIAKKLDIVHQVDIVSTFMGAHALPSEYKDRRQDYINLIIDEMLPLIAKQDLADFCDVFCETGVFSVEESGAILEKAKSLGLKLKIHAEEINNTGGALLAAEMGCISAEHLIKIDDAGIKALAKKNTIAVCLPCTSFYLNEDFAPARKMIEAGVPVAIASDFNPGSSPNLNLQLAMNMACYKYKMTPGEILTAVTLNAAAALGRQADIGSIEEGKIADLLIWDAKDLDYIFYRYGSNLIKTVIKKGIIC